MRRFAAVFALILALAACTQDAGFNGLRLRRNIMRRVTLIGFLLLFAAVLSSCTTPVATPPPPGGIFIPENAYGDELPAEAVLVSEAEFILLTQDPDFRWESQSAREERLRLAEEQFAADTLVMQEWLAQDPSLARFIDDPDLTDPDIVKLPSDNYLYSFVNDLGNTQTVITMGQHANYRDLIAAQEMYEDPENQLTVYTAAYQLLPEALKAALPTPASLAGADLEEILAALALLESTLEGQIEALEQQALAGVQERFGVAGGMQLMGADPWLPGGFPEDPADEERSGTGGDRTGSSSCGGRQADGVYMNFQWPMKYFMTSTKNQGVRGSCVAFALTSAAESLVAVRDARWVNLSEQYLYHRIKADWDEDDFDEGANTADMALEFTVSGFRLPYEDQWNYNPSPNRAVGGNADAPDDFKKSCDGYGERCSNTTHQGEFVCTQVPILTFCGSSPPNPDNSGKKMSAVPVLLWFNFIAELPVNTIRNFLALGQPVVAAIQVTNGFASPNNAGFLVSYSDNVTGGHAVHIVGYISNGQLNDVLPNAPTGGGGGYFIIKNSWGACWGDGGLVYVPVNWAQEYFKNITVYIGAIPAIDYVNTPPTIDITAPADGKTVLQGTINLETFTATAEDNEDGSNCCDIVWTSSEDGQIGIGESIEYGFATPGPRVITATATDSVGHSATDSITINVENPEPLAEIIAPVNGEQIPTGIPYTLQGLASDVGNLGGVPCNQLVWTSTSASDPTLIGCNPQITFTTLGVRVLTLTATDNFGATDVDLVSITVVEPPELWASVTDPKPGDLFFVTDTITLKGIVSQEFDTPATYEWRVYSGGQHTVIASGDALYFILTGNLIVPNADWTPSDDGFTTGNVNIALFIDGANGNAESLWVPITSFAT